MIYAKQRTDQKPKIVRCSFCDSDEWEEFGRKDNDAIYLRCKKCGYEVPFPAQSTRSVSVTSNDIHALRAAKENKLWWSKREGGSEEYQKYRKEIHKLVKAGFLAEYSQKSCCHRQYTLTSMGEAYLGTFA